MGEATGLHCPSCDRRYEAAPSEPYRCACNSPLEVPRTQPLPAAPPTRPDGRGQWAWTDELGLTLGEGWTPRVGDHAWGLRFKLEWQSPTGSFKDRGAAAMVTRARDLGVARVVADSSGNAGAAVATYAARAGIEADIYVPAEAAGAKLRLIERAGGTLHRVDGDRAAVAERAREAVAGSGVWYASHAWRPSFLEGTATFGYELAAGDCPDAVVIGVGNGTLLLGAYRGLRRAQAAGWIDRLPRLYAAQPAGYAPLVDGGGARNTVADGMQIVAPPREEQLRTAIGTTDGTAVAVTQQATTDTLSRLHANGYQVEPSCAVAPAAVATLQDRGAIEPDETVVVPLTGFGVDE